jgi:hypothetical protein
MKRLALLLLCLFVSSPAYCLTETEAKKIYDADTAKVKTGDLNFDWKEYRLAAAQGGAEYFDWHPTRAKFARQMDAGDTNAALKSAQEIQHHNMAEPEGHLLALVVYQKLGDQKDAAFEHTVVKAYLDSILASGDGKSAKTAFVVVTVDEEYFYLNIVMGVGLPAKQSLVNKDGHSYDLLNVKDQDGKEQEIWFNVDISMAKEAEMFGGKLEKK